MSLKLDFDYHVHTIYSGHSGAEMFIPAVLARLAERGTRRALILEHAPPMLSETFVSPSEWFAGREERAAVEGVLAEVRPRRAQFPGREFLCGAEVDADPEKMDGSLMLENLAGLDVVLAATHLVPGGGAFWFSPPEIPDEEKPELLDRWLAWMENIAANPVVNVLAHPGAELHNCSLTGEFGEGFRAAFEPVLRGMAGGGTAFELNEAALGRFGEAALAGYAELVGLAKECGVRFTAGSDAHRGEQLGAYRLVPELAARVGLAEEDFWHPEPAAARG